MMMMDRIKIDEVTTQTIYYIRNNKKNIAINKAKLYTNPFGIKTIQMKINFYRFISNIQIYRYIRLYVICIFQWKLFTGAVFLAAFIV